MKFAQSPYQPDFLPSVEAWLAQVRPDATAWFLVDGGMLEASDRKKLAHQAKVAVQAFKGSALEDFGDYGPWLYQPPVSRRSEWLVLLCAAADGKPALSLVETHHSQGKLQELMVQLAQIAPTGGKEALYCRLADTRILPHLFATLTEQQLGTIAATIDRLSLVNRSGSLSDIRLPTSHEDGRGSTSSICLDDAQFAAMIEASEADAVFSLLTDTAPDLVPHADLFNFHNLIQRTIASGRKRGISSTNEQLQFSILSIMLGEDFHLHPALTPTWETLSKGSTTFSACVSSWNSSIWKALENRNTP